jgi:large subunit ribosomal protein L16
MLIKPRKTKYKKLQKGRISSQGIEAKTLVHGSLGLRALQSAYVSSNQLESARQTLTRHLQRQGRVWIRPFPDYPVTTKSLGARIGKGKGNVDRWVCRLVAGQLVFEVDGADLDKVKQALRSAGNKLPFRLCLHI